MKETPGELGLPKKFKFWRDGQLEAIEAVSRSDKRMYLLDAPTGTGKCLGLGTPIIMADGSVRLVENIKPGEALMGPDSKPRLVKTINRGRAPLFKIVPKKGDSFIVNEEHILSLKLTRGVYKPRRCAKAPYGSGYHGGLQDRQICELSLKEYQTKSDSFKLIAKLYKVPVEFISTPVEIDPYFLGLWLGDGSSQNVQITTADNEIVTWLRNYANSLSLKFKKGQVKGQAASYALTTGRGGRADKNPLVNYLRRYGVYGAGLKRIPEIYLHNDTETRLRVLAGLLDTDGYYKNVFEITQVNAGLASDIKYLASSLGFQVSDRPKIIKGKPYHRLFISGNLDMIPCLIKRKQPKPRRQKKDWRVSGFEVKALSEGDYFGFELEGDGRFLLGDFTVTHNSLVGIGSFAKIVTTRHVIDILADHEQSKYRCLYVTRTKQLQDQVLREFPAAKTIKGRSNYPCNLFPDKYPEITAEDCQKDKCNTSCAYTQAKNEALRAPVAVLNDSYFLAEANGPGQFSGADLVVLDEVDSLENVMMNFIQMSITERQLTSLQIKAPPKNKMRVAQTWLSWAEDARYQAQAGTKTLQAALEKSETTAWSGVELRLNRQVTRLQSFVQKLSAFIQDVNEFWVFGYEETKAGWKVVFKPVRVAEYTDKYLWSHGERFLGMSGTIFDDSILANDLGITEWDYSRMDSPFPVENRPIYYTPLVDLKYTRMQTELPKLVAAVDDILARYDTRVLVHTVSYHIRDYLMNNLRCQKRLMTHNSDDREEMLGKFKSSLEPSVMISPSFDRGVDLPDEGCRCVIICKVPYLNLSDDQVRARLQLRDGQRWYDLKAAQSIVQMSGRAVRSKHDYCDCVSPEAMILTGGLQWRRSDALKVGDRLLGFDEKVSSHWRRWRWGEVEATGIENLPRFRISLKSGKTLVSTPNHMWLSRNGQHRTSEWLRTDELKPGHSLKYYIDVWDENTTYEGGWLSGLMDGEGSLILRCGKRNPQVMRIVLSQKPGAVLDRACEIVKGLGFRVEWRLHKNGVVNLWINGGLSELLRFLGQIRPVRLLKKFEESERQECFKAKSFDTIISVEDIGVGPMVTLQSSIETYIAEGYGAHNTFILDRRFTTLLARTRHMIPKWWQEAIIRKEKE